jgi:hypothetical protein
MPESSVHNPAKAASGLPAVDPLRHLTVNVDNTLRITDWGAIIDTTAYR